MDMDLYNEGVIGLMDSASRFDYSKGYKFETFCKQRVIGAILDYQRRIDYMKRCQRNSIDEKDIPHNMSLSMTIREQNHGGGNDQQLKDVIVNDKIIDPIKEAIVRDWSIYLDGLSNAEKIIVVLYYIEDLKMKDIGKTLGVCESRVSQMHTLLISRIKAKLMRLNKTYLDFV
jgi:RNA polymerase sigma factor for flagellar operon FliA